MVVALTSLLRQTPVKHATAMTGEITLRGKVLPIGGVKQKALAAHRAGVKYLLLPAENRKDLPDIPKDVRRGLRIAFVGRVDEVLQRALCPVAVALPVPKDMPEAQPTEVLGPQPVPATPESVPVWTN